MKNFSTRKSAEITGTPERAGTSRVQGNKKKGKPGDENPFGLLSYEEDDEDEDMKEVQDATQERVVLRDSTEGATEEKGMYPLFAPPSAKGIHLNKPNITDEVNVIQGTQQLETGAFSSTATVNEERGRNRNKMTTTEETTKKAASTRSGRKGKGPKRVAATEEEGTLATAMITEATTATEVSKVDSTEGLTLPKEGLEGEDTSGKVPHVTI